MNPEGMGWTAMPRKPNAQDSLNGRLLEFNSVKVRFCSAEEQTELQAQLRELADEIASGLSSLEPTQSKELLGTFVSDLCLSVAEQERRAIRRQQQIEGIEAAKQRGVRFGRSRKPLPENFDECRRKWRNGEIKMCEAAEACGMAKSSFYEAAIRMEQSIDRVV